MTMGSTSVERWEGKDFVAMRMIAPTITRTHQEHQMFEDMLPMEDVREPSLEQDTVNEVESQGSRTNEGEPEEPVESEVEDLREQEEAEEEADQEEEEARSGGSSCESCGSTILLPQRRKGELSRSPR